MSARFRGGGFTGAGDLSRRAQRELPGEVEVEVTLHKAHLQALAFEIADEVADEVARADIECHCMWEHSGPHRWYDLRRCERLVRAGVDRSVAYIEARGADLTGYRMIRSAALPHMVRFEDEQA